MGATPKERYEARKKLKQIARDPNEPSDAQLKEDFATSLLERFVVAVERIADAMEDPTP